MQTHLGYLGICGFDVYENDVYIKHIEVKNQLTYGGQHCLLRGITNDSKNYLYNAILGNGITVPPDVSNTIGVIENPYKKALTFIKTTIATSSTQSLGVTWRLEISEYNGHTISELGLSFLSQDSNELLFCRVTLDELDQVYKSSKITLNGIWNITVTESAS